MSLLDGLTYDSTAAQVVESIVEELVARGYTHDEAIGVIADGYQESRFKMVWDPSHRWFGYFQQDGGYPNRTNPAGNVRGFLDRLDVKRRSPGHGDIWGNIFWLQQRPSEASAADALNDPQARLAYLSEIKSRTPWATTTVDRFWPKSPVVTPPAVTPPPATPGAPVTALADPITKTLWTAKNRYANRGGMLSPMWIACHTSESLSRAVNLRNFCENNGVSYNRIGDDVDIVGMVRDTDGPWAAVGANNYAHHYCWSFSFAGWSRGQWLDPDAANDGFDERAGLRLGAKQMAFWIQQSREVGRPILVEWIGGRQRPPWGLNGICGHVDFGQWGGGHSDPGVNFPVDILLSDIREWLTGQEQPPVVVPSPVVVPGTNPDAYANWMLYQGNPRNDPDKVTRVQRRLKAMFSYGKDLVADGDFGPKTRQAVFTFQDRSGLVPDGIVGPMTAAALKP